MACIAKLPNEVTLEIFGACDNPSSAVHLAQTCKRLNSAYKSLHERDLLHGTLHEITVEKTFYLAALALGSPDGNESDGSFRAYLGRFRTTKKQLKQSIQECILRYKPSIRQTTTSSLAGGYTIPTRPTTWQLRRGIQAHTRVMQLSKFITHIMENGHTAYDAVHGANIRIDHTQLQSAFNFWHFTIERDSAHELGATYCIEYELGYEKGARWGTSAISWWYACYVSFFSNMVPWSGGGRIMPNQKDWMLSFDTSDERGADEHYSRFGATLYYRSGLIEVFLRMEVPKIIRHNRKSVESMLYALENGQSPDQALTDRSTRRAVLDHDVWSQIPFSVLFTDDQFAEYIGNTVLEGRVGHTGMLMHKDSTEAECDAHHCRFSKRWGYAAWIVSMDKTDVRGIEDVLWTWMRELVLAQGVWRLHYKRAIVYLQAVNPYSAQKLG